MSSPLMLAAEEARRLLQQYGFTDEEAEITASSETRLPDVIARLVEAEVADEAAIDACKARAHELRMRAERLQGRIDRRRDEIAAALESAGLKKLDAGSATVSLTESKPGVVIIDPEVIPTRFLVPKTTHALSKAFIRKALEAGEEVPGATLSNARRTIAVRRT